MVAPRVRQAKSWRPQHREELELLERVQRRHQDEQREGAALLGGKVGRIGIDSLEKFWGDLIPALQCMKELQERWRESFYRDRTQGMASNHQRIGLDGRLGRNSSL